VSRNRRGNGEKRERREEEGWGDGRIIFTCTFRFQNTLYENFPTSYLLPPHLPLSSYSLLPTPYSLLPTKVKKLKQLFWLQIKTYWGLIFSLLLLTACSSENIPIGSTSLNSRFTEEQPALSGNGRFLAFVSNRNGTHQLLVYDLERQQFMSAPRLNRPDTIVESPSLSYTGRYLAYITSDQGRPVVGLYDRIAQQTQVLTPIYRGWVRNPNISPDGRYVVFETTVRGQWDIEVLDRGPNIELDIPNGAPVNAPPGVN
jgi:WD40-like Beta Propeller Repeat